MTMSLKMTDPPVIPFLNVPTAILTTTLRPSGKAALAPTQAGDIPVAVRRTPRLLPAVVQLPAQLGLWANSPPEPSLEGLPG